MTRSNIVPSVIGIFALSLVVVFLTLIKTTATTYRATFDSPPVANSDTYTVHGGGTIGPLTDNDHDPDGDTMDAVIVTFPSHGQLFGLTNNRFSYQLSVQSFRRHRQFYL